MMRIISLGFGWHLLHEERLRADYETAKACEDHNRRANRAEYTQAQMRKLGLQWKRRAELAEAKNEQLFAALMQHVGATTPVVPAGPIPDPPSVSAADARVAVALRDREAAPLKRPLRPGEDE